MNVESIFYIKINKKNINEIIKEVINEKENNQFLVLNQLSK